MKFSIKILLYSLLACFSSASFAQQNIASDGYKISLISSFVSQGTAPMWQTGNVYGIVPDNSAGIVEAEVYKSFSTFKDNVKVHLGADIVSSFSNTRNLLFPSQLYLSLEYRTVLVDFGTRHDAIRYNGLSTTNGEIQWSGNARSLPGYNVSLTKFLTFGDFIGFNFKFGDFFVNDDRYMGDNTLMHKDKYSIRVTPVSNFAVTASLDRIAYWAGGENSIRGKQPSGFKNYLKILKSQSGGGDALVTDQMNALGNTLGAYNVDMKYCFSDDREVSIYYSHPFEDKSGLKFWNKLDGVWGVYFKSGAGNNRFSVKHFVYEYIYTKYQSGEFHVKPDGNFMGGRDNYFNNGVYCSGHTYFSKTVGLPLMYPLVTEEGSTSKGIRNNRLIGHHFGFDGCLWQNIPFKVLLTSSHNFGTYSDPLDAKDYHVSTQIDIASKLKFIDAVFSTDIVSKGRLNIILGGYYSRYGEDFFNENCWGESLKVSFSGNF